MVTWWLRNKKGRFGLYLLLILGVIGPIEAQLDYKGIIVDALSNEPIPYVNIGIVDQGIGTVSDGEGIFHLELQPEKYSERDTLQFSSMGYKTMKKAIPDLEFVLNEYPKIIMSPETVLLNEIIVSNKGVLTEVGNESVGYLNRGEKVYGYWKDDVALGGELATKIRVKKGLRLLRDFSFTVLQNPSDSLLLRLNIYKGDTKLPEKKLTQKDILFTLNQPSGTVRVFLEPHKIYVENDFIVSLELLKVYGGEIALVLLASESSGTSFKRYASQDKWKRLRAAALAFRLNTTLLEAVDSDELAEPDEDFEYRKISGFVFHKGKAVGGVTVKNQITNKTTLTDAKGRYEIEAEENDFIIFSYQGMESAVKKVSSKPTINASLTQK